jgi:phage baseplate assembly protein W
LTQKIINGDYVKSQNGTALESVDYIDELLQSVRIILSAERGKFYPDKNFGSHLKNIANEPRTEYALAYARQAVDTLDGVFVKKAELVDGSMIFDLTINNEERQVSLDLENDIQ